MKRLRFSNLRSGSVMVILVMSVLVLGACNSLGSRQGSDDSSEGDASVTSMAALAVVETGVDGADPAAVEMTDAGMATEPAGEQAARISEFAAPPVSGVRVIRDVRVEAGKFAEASSRIRTVAEDLGGYISAGETHLETIDETDYTVGWFTMRVPEGRFDEALTRVDDLGERLDLQVSSQDVSEEYVDLDGRLRYWEGQETFYSRLMDEATTIDELVTIQTRMQEVLLNIEQIEGRLRYLESRTEYSTLTVGLTEVPGAVPDVGSTPNDPGIVEAALEQAGAVLLGTVGFLIVGAAFLLFRAIQATRRRPSSSGS
jgi:hypothetical protein